MVKLYLHIFQVTEQEFTDIKDKVVVLSMPLTKFKLRIVMCSNHNTEDVRLAIKKVQYVLHELVKK